MIYNIKAKMCYMWLPLFSITCSKGIEKLRKLSLRSPWISWPFMSASKAMLSGVEGLVDFLD